MEERQKQLDKHNEMHETEMKRLRDIEIKMNDKIRAFGLNQEQLKAERETLRKQMASLEEKKQQMHGRNKTYEKEAKRLLEEEIKLNEKNRTQLLDHSLLKGERERLEKDLEAHKAKEQQILTEQARLNKDAKENLQLKADLLVQEANIKRTEQEMMGKEAALKAGEEQLLNERRLFQKLALGGVIMGVLVFGSLITITLLLWLRGRKAFLRAEAVVTMKSVSDTNEHLPDRLECTSIKEKTEVDDNTRATETMAFL